MCEAKICENQKSRLGCLHAKGRAQTLAAPSQKNDPHPDAPNSPPSVGSRLPSAMMTGTSTHHTTADMLLAPTELAIPRDRVQAKTGTAQERGDARAAGGVLAGLMALTSGMTSADTAQRGFGVGVRGSGFGCSGWGSAQRGPGGGVGVWGLGCRCRGGGHRRT